jgi:hypothetical protein
MVDMLEAVTSAAEPGFVFHRLEVSPVLGFRELELGVLPGRERCDRGSGKILDQYSEFDRR